VQVEQQNVSIAGADLLELLSKPLRIPISRFTIRNMQNGWRVAVRMGITPCNQLLRCGCDCIAHGGAASGFGLEPHRKLYGLVYQAACSVINPFNPVFNAQG